MFDNVGLFIENITWYSRPTYGALDVGCWIWSWMLNILNAHIKIMLHNVSSS